jgi:hypothetical protein
MTRTVSVSSSTRSSTVPPSVCEESSLGSLGVVVSLG